MSKVKPVVPTKIKSRVKYKTNNPKISLIAAVSLNGVIGNNNSIPWRLKGDMHHFKNYTFKKMVLMGANTFESLPFLLKDRLTIVLSSNFERVQNVVNSFKEKHPDKVVPPVIHFSSFQELRDGFPFLKDEFPDFDPKELVVCGGATLYHNFMNLADRIILTVVDSTVQGDTYWPKQNLEDLLDSKKWKIIDIYNGHADEHNEYKYKIFTYEKPLQATVIDLSTKSEITKLDRVCNSKM